MRLYTCRHGKSALKYCLIIFIFYFPCRCFWLKMTVFVVRILNIVHLFFCTTIARFATDSLLATICNVQLNSLFFYRACKHEMVKKNLDQAKKISAHFLSENPCSISMWKVYHSLTLNMLHVELVNNLLMEKITWDFQRFLKATWIKTF